MAKYYGQLSSGSRIFGDTIEEVRSQAGNQPISSFKQYANNAWTDYSPTAPQGNVGGSPPTNTAIQGITSTQGAQGSSSYIIKSGDNLSTIARTNNTTVAEMMRLNPQIKNPNLIIAGQSLTLPGGTTATSGAQDFSGITTNADAINAINGNQQSDAAGATVSGEPPTRKTTAEVMAGVESLVTPETQAPTAPDYTGALNEYRSTYGITDLETQLNELNAQAEEITAQKEARITSERGKAVAMNVISGRIGQVEQQENERLAVIQRSITNATNQLNTKYNIVNALMKTKEMDYNAAVTSYDKEMANNIAMYNAAKNIEEADKTEEEHLKDDARSNAQILLNAYTDSGLTYDQIPETEKITLTKLSVQSGLGADFFANVLKGSGGKKPLYNVLSADETKMSYMYADGSTKVFSTGLPAKPTSTTQDNVTADEIKVYYKSSMSEQLKNAVGTYKYLNPTQWAKARSSWATKTPYTAAEFDELFMSYVDPANPTKYAGFENYRSIKDTKGKAIGVKINK